VEVALFNRSLNDLCAGRQLNELGQEAHPELTWRYRAMPGCSLQWAVYGADSAKEVVKLPLSGAGIDLRFNQANQMSHLLR
jgi:hypothetical protein